MHAAFRAASREPHALRPPIEAAQAVELGQPARKEARGQRRRRAVADGVAAAVAALQPQPLLDLRAAVAELLLRDRSVVRVTLQAAAHVRVARRGGCGRGRAG